MPVAPDFRLYHGNDLDVLARLLATQLAEPAPGLALLAPDTILIPQPAMRRWLQKTLAEAHGIAANLRFLTPGEFVRDALAANLPGDDAATADAATLRWRLWSVLADEQAMRAPVFAPLQPVLSGADRGLAAWTLAGELAAAFEKYQAWRRGWLLRWDGGADAGDWQAELWRRATHGLAHRARRLHAYLQRFDGDGDGGGAEVPRGLPPRLFVFACQNVSPDVLRVIASAARAGTLHFFFASPVRGWWGDLPGARERLRADADGVFAADQDNPLLLANGAAGRDFVNLLFAGEAVHPTFETTAYAEPETVGGGRLPTLLHELQHDLLARRPPPSPSTRAFDPADRSLQVHACHTPLREVQVLHEHLRTLLEADPTLQPRDIAVLAPDIDAYAPLVHAVFGGAKGVHAIPYAVADGSALASRPLAGWWLQLLALPTARFTLPEGIALLSPAPVLQHLGLAPATLERLADALRAAGARWGRDPAHRDAYGGGTDPEFTWQWAIDRLLLGHATGGDEDLEGLAPLPALDGSELPAFDALLGGLRVLERLARDAARPRPAAEWNRVLAAALTDLLPERAALPADRRAIDALRAAVGELAQEWQDAQPDGDVPVEVLLAWFEERFAAPDTQQAFLAGGVMFGRMVPMRLIPFRVICLLGMDDEAYPRRDPGGALNRLAAEIRTPARAPGDRSVREDDRFLFLQLLAAAGTVFHVSYVGTDPRSGEVRPPSVVVAELVDVAARYRCDDPVAAVTGSPADAAPAAAPAAAIAARVAGRLVVRHPLHPFAPQAFGAPWNARECGDDAARRVPWHDAWRPAVAVAAGPRQPLPAFVDAVLPAAADDPRAITRDQLVRALSNPSRHFLERRLAVRLPRDEDPLPADEPFALDDALHRFVLARRLFAALHGGADDLDALRARLVAEAMLPPGPAGIELFERARALAGGCARLARRWAPDPPASRPWRLDLGDVALTGRFDAEHVAGLLQFRPGPAHGGAQIGFGIDRLAWHALGDKRPVVRLLPGAVPEELPVIAAETARDALAALVALAQTAAREALPFLPKAGHRWFADRHDADRADQKSREEWLGSDFRRGEGDDAWVRLALRGRDPFADDDGLALQRFRELSEQVFGLLTVGDEAVFDD